MTHKFLDVIEKVLKDKSLDNKNKRFIKSFSKKVRLINDTKKRYEAAILAMEMEDVDIKTKEKIDKLKQCVDNSKDLDELDEWLKRSIANADLPFDERYESSKNIRSRNVLRKTINTEKQDIKNFKSFLSETYRVPDKPRDVLSHLNTLLCYHIDIGPISHKLPKHIRMQMDLVTVLLMQAGASDPTVIEKYGRTFDRTRKSKKAKAEKKSKSAQKVIETCSRIKGKSEMKPHTLAKKIKDIMEKSQRSVPSVDTIKRYLREEGLI